MIRIEKGDAHTRYDYWMVQVDTGDLVVAGGKAVPHPTWIGTFTRDGKVYGS